ncbi:MAG TPA: helix-turn-helix domain-containing protein [Thermoanaerobaculia bacterium]|nr:helix-turn-helix domain-containing protein [Thermoanaerobaculia bacterium]
MITNRIARNVQILREHYGWSLNAIAERAGITVNIVKHLLKDGSNPGIGAVVRLANAAGLSLSELTGDELDRTKLPGESAIVARYLNPAAMSAAIGARVRAYRLRENWSRRRFIEHAKISKGMLHYIETNGVEPSVAMVERLASAFDMTLAEFVEAEESQVIAVGRHIRDFDDCTVAGPQRIDVPVAPRGSTAMLYVVEGAICVSFDSDQRMLESGDAMLLMTDRPYTVASTSDERARFLRFNRMRPNYGHELAQA